MKKIKSIILLLCSFLMLTGFIQPNDLDRIALDNERKEINRLLDERAGALNNNNNNKINQIDVMLEEFNVQKIEFSSIEPSLREEIEATNINWLTLPSGGNQTWWQRKETRVNRGYVYDVQTFYCQPKNTNSSFYGNGTATQTAYPTTPAGNTIVLKILVSAAVSEIHVLSYTKTVFQVLANINNPPSYSTVVANIQANYTWAMTTTANFIFVRHHNASYNTWDQKLSSTKTRMEIGTTIPSLTFSNGQAIPQVVFSSETKYYQPKGYDDVYLAMDNFYFGRIRSLIFVENIKLYGLMGVHLTTINPPRPNHYSEATG